jgi:predicted DCC family thiol-disulfide oxidoreductase YuxK
MRETMKKTVLIYDASCPVCSKTVKWIEGNEVKNSFEMLPCGSKILDARFPNVDRAACEQAIHLVLPDGAVLSGEKALPEIFKRLRRYRSAAILFKLPGAAIVSRILYRWFADRRYGISKFIHISPTSHHREE